MNRRQMMVVVATLLTVGAGASSARDPTKDGVEVGTILPNYAATVACGPLEAEQPFDTQKFGKVRGFNPLATIKGRAVVLYTRVLDDRFFDLATAVDSLAAKDVRLGRSIVIVLDEKGAQRGGYTVEELAKRREEIGRLADSHGVKRLSFFISAPSASAAGPELGLIRDDVVILLAERMQDRARTKVEWKKSLRAATITEKDVRDAIASIQKAMPPI